METSNHWVVKRSRRHGDVELLTCAIVRAKLDAGVAADALLKDAGLDMERWEREEEVILAGLADDVERGNLDRFNAYRAEYRAAGAAVIGHAPVEAAAAPEPVRAAPPLDAAPAPLDCALSSDPPPPRSMRSSVTEDLDPSVLRRAVLPFHAEPRMAFPSSTPPRTIPPPGPLAQPSAQEELMPLEHYAAIAAALTRERNPEATLQRLGLDPSSWMATVHAYAARLRDDPALEAVFDDTMERALHHAR